MKNNSGYFLLVLLGVGLLLGGCGLIGSGSEHLDSWDRFQNDNTSGATANALERLPQLLGGCTCIICAFLGLVILALYRVRDTIEETAAAKGPGT